MTSKISKIKTSAREKALIVAEELIESKGYANVSARAIAKEAKISVGTLYHHFPKGKPDILTAIGMKYAEILKMTDFLKNPNADPTGWLQEQLKVSQNKRAFITAVELEGHAHADEFAKLYGTRIRMDRNAHQMMEKLAGKTLDKKVSYRMILVLKTLIRRHVVFGNIFGSNAEFIEMLLKIARTLAED